MLGRVQLWEEPDGKFTATRMCARIRKRLYAFKCGETVRGVTFPADKIRADSELALRAELAQGVVWA